MKRWYSVLFLCMLLTAPAFSQESQLGSLSDAEFLRAVASLRSNDGSAFAPVTGIGEEKCGLFLTAEVVRRLETMNTRDARRLQELMVPAARDTYIVSPSGRFRIHFDTTGRHAAALLDGNGARRPGTAIDYAKEAALYYDQSFEKQVLQLGYPEPPRELGASWYNVYVLDFGTSTYGQTITVSRLSSSTVMPIYTTYIEMDNDFLGFYTPGLNGAKVTAAHEFHHMVQLGSYGFWSNDRYFHEMTSTYFEDVVYDEVNDYYQYLPAFFRYTDRSLYGWGGGYETVLWLLYLDTRFGPAIVRNIWEGMRSRDPISSIAEVLTSYQSDFSGEYCMFAGWNYRTGLRTGEFGTDSYSDARSYPDAAISSSLNLISSSVLFSGEITPLASGYYQAYRGGDTVTFAVGNVDIASAIMKSNTGTGFTLEVLLDGSGPDRTLLANGWGYRFQPAAQNSLCLTILSQDAVVDAGITAAFPNPFDPASDGVLRFPVDRARTETSAALAIYSAGMDLVYSKDKVDIQKASSFGRFVVWNGKTDSGEPAASGIYFYVLGFGDETENGKFAVIRR